MKIIHGKTLSDVCAAAAVICELASPYERNHDVFGISSESDFIEVLNNEAMELEEDNHNGMICFIGVELTDKMLEFIDEAVKKKYHVLYINTSDFKVGDSHNKQFFRSFCKHDISTALLTWTYTCMNPDERVRCDTIAFDYAYGRSHIMFDMDGREEYVVPAIIRYIDIDQDDDSSGKEGHNDFMTNLLKLESDSPEPINWITDPTDKKWEDLLYYGDREVYSIASMHKTEKNE